MQIQMKTFDFLLPFALTGLFSESLYNTIEMTPWIPQRGTVPPLWGG